MAIVPSTLPARANKIALFSKNGHCYITENFQSASPTWQAWDMEVVVNSLGRDDDEVDHFVVDPFSPAFQGTGNAVNGWITTKGRPEKKDSQGNIIASELPGKIYRLRDIFGSSPSATPVKNTDGNDFQFKFPAISYSVDNTGVAVGRNIQASLVQPGLVVIGTHYQGWTTDAEEIGTFFTYTLDGGAVDSEGNPAERWLSETAINLNREGNRHREHDPSLYLSSKVPYKVWMAAYKQSGFPPEDEGPIGTLYEAILPDPPSAPAWNEISTPPSFLHGLGNELHVPWNDNPDESIIYYGGKEIDASWGSQSYKIFRSDGIEPDPDDISPRIDGSRYGRPPVRGGVDSYINDRRKMFLIGSKDGSGGTGPGGIGVFRSVNGGDSWTCIVQPDTKIRRGEIAGNNGDVLYLFGEGGQIWYSEDGGATLRDKRGYLSTTREIIGITGAYGIASEPCHTGNCSEYAYATSDSLKTGNPISLRKGEKRLTETDISLTTPSGALTFTRSYQQSQQGNENYQFMGLGWTHDHKAKLEVSSLSADVYLPNGGILKLRRESESAVHFDSEPGSNCALDLQNGLWTLTTPDQNTLVFGHPYNNSYRLESRSWASGETWYYFYASDVVDDPESHRLVRVDDGYGRGLKFAYTSLAWGGEPQLLRVGDQNSIVEGGNPSGRYVEFGYLQEKKGGVLNGSGALLASVRDVRGNVWQYEYYGQSQGETNDALLNFLVTRKSPSVDTDGDEQPDGQLILESLTYTVEANSVTGITQNRGQGLLNTTLAFDVLGPNGEQTTTETIAAQTSTHYFEHGVYAGSEDDLHHRSRQMPSPKNYRPEAQEDANGNSTTLAWSPDGKLLNQVTDALGNSTTFIYDEKNRVWSSADAEKRETHYIYDGDNRQPTMVLVGINRAEKVVNGGMEETSGWNNINSPSVNIRSSTQVDTGTYSRYVEANSGSGIESAASIPLEAHRTYIVTARVYLVTNRPVKMTIMNCSAFDTFSTTESGKWQTLQAIHTVMPGEVHQEQKLRFLAEANGAKFYVDSVSMRPALEVDVNGGMEAADGWSPVVSASSTRLTTQVDSGDHARHVVADAGAGIESINWNLEPGQTYTIRARVYPVSGTVKMQVPNVSAIDVITHGTGAWETLEVTHLSSAHIADQTLQFIAYGGSAEFYLDTVSIRTTGKLDVNGDMDVDSGWSIVGGAGTTNMLTDAPKDSGTHSRHVVSDAADKGIESVAINLIAHQTYTIRARVYATGGTVKLRLVDNNGVEIASTTCISKKMAKWETLSCRYIPASDKNNAKLQFIAYNAAADFYVDTVSIQLERDLSTTIGGDMEPENTWNGWNNPTTNELSVRADTGSYYRRIQANMSDGIQSIGIDLAAGHTYLVMARVYLATNTNVRMGITDIAGFDTVTNNALKNNWQTLRAVYTVPTTASGRLQFLAEANGADFGVDTIHLLDLGVISGSLAEQAQWQEFAYDNRGRVTAEYIVNPVDAHLIRKTTRTYHTFGNGSGLLRQVHQYDVELGSSVYNTYSYDSAGRVIMTQSSSTVGSCLATYIVYDISGNLMASICNYVPGNRADPTTAEEAADFYDEAKPGDNHVTTHRFDEMGRQVATTTNDGSEFKQTTLTFYDALDRVKRTITNYHPQDNSAPGDWVWNLEAIPPRWERSSTDSTAIGHGDEQNQNIISDTEYNDRGMVKLQRNVLGQVTLFGYDDAGRLVKTVQNASHPTHNNNFDSGPNPDPSLAAYNASNNPDEDIVTTSNYDAVGNLVRSVDAAGRVTFTVYDKLNRPEKVVRYAKADATIDPNDPNYSDANDPRSTTYDPSEEPDRDLIEWTRYGAAGQVIETEQLLEMRGEQRSVVTRYVYDDLDRQVKTISNYVAQGGTDPANWIWNANATPPRWEDSSGYAINHGENDQNLITETVYDSAGRVQYTRDVTGNRTWFVYDGLGRQTKTITNCSYDAGSPTPQDASYVGALDDPAADIIGQTFYDANGRVQKTKRVLKTNEAGTELEWLWTIQGYDSLGRQVKTIQNASNPNYVDNYPDLSGYVASGNSDEDRITQTVYDNQGRVQRVIDPIGNITLYGYDTTGRRIKTIQNASNPGYDVNSDPDLSAYTPSVGAKVDQDRITTTEYDIAGRVTRSIDPAGLETRYVYDALGRRIRTVNNYVPQGGSVPAEWNWANGQWVDGGGVAINHGDNDQNLISDTTYNKAGQVIATRDVRGTQTEFVYDAAGRRQQVIQAVGSSLQSTTYTCYDKAGRVLRAIDNWILAYDAEGNPISPDVQDNGEWTFKPVHHGTYNDQNRVVEYSYNGVGRRVGVVDPIGNQSTTTYHLSGQVDATTDPEGVISLNRYDRLGRLTLVVQSYHTNGEDPANWVWDSQIDHQWEKSNGTLIGNGLDFDQNVIVQVAYDKAGRKISQRDPMGHLTVYRYDKLGRRRVHVTNYVPQLDSLGREVDPVSWQWDSGSGSWKGQLENPPATVVISHGTNNDENKFITRTSYADQLDGTEVTVIKPDGTNTIRTSDRLNRLVNIEYGDLATTPKVKFAYDAAGNRSLMEEYGPSGKVRGTEYKYDDARRLTEVEFDTNGDESIVESVSYSYDVSGLRTQMTMVDDNLTVTYAYDQQGRLVGLTDWDGHSIRYAYDQAGRLLSKKHNDGLRSRYVYDAGSRLRQLKHTAGSKTYGYFAYEVDGRGNRTQALELLAHPGTTWMLIPSSSDAIDYYQGTWNTDNDFKVSDDFGAALRLMFFSKEAKLRLGEGPHNGICDVYVSGSLWRSFDTYAPEPGEREAITIPLQSEGPHLLDIRNRAEHNLASRGYQLRFKNLEASESYDLHTIEYVYDNLSRLQEARYNPGQRTGLPDPDLLRHYRYNYDRAGNRLWESVTLNGGTPVETIYGYNAVNQINNQGFVYDANGNLTSDGTNTYTWDRANRLLSVGRHSYAYDGQGNRISQTVNDPVTSNDIVTSYLLDVQPGLVKVLAEISNNNPTKHYLFDQRGILAQEDSNGNWVRTIHDGLGSVRAEVNDALEVSAMQHYTPPGVPYGELGSFGTPFMFTGEMMDNNGLNYLRARYYDPGLGVFTGLDPVEGDVARVMSLNRYGYVQAEPINHTDPSGMTPTLQEKEYFCNEPSLKWDNASACPDKGASVGNKCCYRYDGLAAREYAKKYALRSNNLFCSINYDEGDPCGITGTDCANFVSQALLNGGMPMRENVSSQLDSWFCKINHSTIKRCGSGTGGKVPNWTGALELSTYISKLEGTSKIYWSDVDSEMTTLVPELSDWETVFDVFQDLFRVITAATSLANKNVSVGDVLYTGPAGYEHVAMIVYWGPLLLTWEQIIANNQFSDKQTPANPIPYIVDHGNHGIVGGSDYAGPRPFYSLWWALPIDKSIDRWTAQHVPIPFDTFFVHLPSEICIPATEAIESSVARETMMQG